MALGALLSGFLGKAGGGMMAGASKMGGGLKAGAGKVGGSLKNYYTGADIKRKSKKITAKAPGPLGGEGPTLTGTAREKQGTFDARKKREVGARVADTATAIGTAAAAIFSKPKKRTAAEVYREQGAGRRSRPVKAATSAGPVQSAQAVQSAQINLGQSGPGLSDYLRRARQRGRGGSAGGAGGMS